MKVNVKSDFSGLAELKKAFDEKLETQVGILAGSKSRTADGGEAVTNATLGATHEFGSFTKNIPARSWLRMPIQDKANDIKDMVFKARKSIAKGMSEGSNEKLFAILGISAESIIQMAFESGGFGKWKPLAQSTIKAKGSSAQLIDTGQLRESVLSKVVKKNG